MTLPESFYFFAFLPAHGVAARCVATVADDEVSSAALAVDSHVRAWLKPTEADDRAMWEAAIDTLGYLREAESADAAEADSLKRANYAARLHELYAYTHPEDATLPAWMEC